MSCNCFHMLEKFCQRNSYTIDLDSSKENNHSDKYKSGIADLELDITGYFQSHMKVKCFILNEILCF